MRNFGQLLNTWTNDQRLMSAILFTICSGVGLFGCSNAALHPALVRAGYRLDFRVNKELASCDDPSAFRQYLPNETQARMTEGGERELRVAIDRQHGDQKRIFVEIVDSRGNVVDHVDHIVRDKHVDCARALHLAATFASSMIEKTSSSKTAKATGSEKKEAKAYSKPILTPRLERSERPVRVTEPGGKRASRAISPEPEERIPEKLDRPKYWTNGPADEPNGPLRQRNREAPLQQAPAYAQPPITINNYNGPPPKEEKGEQMDPFAGGHVLFGVGAIRGPDARLNLGGRLGAGYVNSSGKFAIEVDVTGAGAVKQFANNPTVDSSALFFGANLGLCGRSSSMGVCLLGAAMVDGYEKPNWNFGYALGPGTRSWIDISATENWFLRVNIEMTLPVYISAKDAGATDPNPRMFAPIVPVGALFLTLVRSPKAGSNGDKKK